FEAAVAHREERRADGGSADAAGDGARAAEALADRPRPARPRRRLARDRVRVHHRQPLTNLPEGSRARPGSWAPDATNDDSLTSCRRGRRAAGAGPAASYAP